MLSFSHMSVFLVLKNIYIWTHLPLNCCTSAVLEYRGATGQTKTECLAVIKSACTCVEKVYMYFSNSLCK